MKRFTVPLRKEWLMFILGAVLALAVIDTIFWIKNMQTPLKPKTAHITIPWIPSTVKRWDEPIGEMAKKYNIDPNLLAIVMTIESGGYSKATSEAGAKGLMQITPPTAGDIAKKFLKEPTDNYDLSDPRTSIEFGAAYLAYLRDEFGTAKQGPSWDSTVELITAGYNGGPGAANKLEQGKGLTDTQTVVYSRDAFNMWRERHSQTSPTFDRWVERGGSNLLDQAKQEQ
jgi:soluble lytic murein transglycosylase-like protein